MGTDSGGRGQERGHKFRKSGTGDRDGDTNLKIGDRGRERGLKNSKVGTGDRDGDRNCGDSDPGD